ncbi:MAG: cobyric acid synthase [Acidobacteria bacterium]|nr:cobyric acid synthase [Acidobacteriota bacterium]
MRARAIMVLGTSSHVGKSLLTAALCRIFAQQGHSVAPFKSQNMSLNSAVTPDGLEIGRAQALQAEAAGILPSVHMNPILLKPSGNMSSQVVVRGKIWGNLTASNYHLRRVEELFPIVADSYETLASQHDIIILEGAGSPAEINLKQHDIVNMRMASHANAACILVGDIDRGGVFASLFGTIALLDPPEQNLIRGFLINKFRGDLSLLDSGIRMMEDRLAKPCIGVLPYLPQLNLDEEDSLGLPPIDATTTPPWLPSNDPTRPLRVAVIALPSFSNFTDFDALHAEPSVSLQLTRDPQRLAHADILILPGSKQTANDLLWLRSTGLAAAVLHHTRTRLTIGICGGMQMLGQQILDPTGIERAGTLPGLGLLPIHSSMQPVKTTRISSGHLIAPSLFNQPTPRTAISGYEIHVGETHYLPHAIPFATLQTEASQHTFTDGCVSTDARTFGTYMHGLFDDDTFRHAFLTAARASLNLAPASSFTDWKQQREAALNRLADTVRASLDMPQLFSWVGLTYTNATAHATSEQPQP